MFTAFIPHKQRLITSEIGKREIRKQYLKVADI